MKAPERESSLEFSMIPRRVNEKDSLKARLLEEQWGLEMEQLMGSWTGHGMVH